MQIKIYINDKEELTLLDSNPMEVKDLLKVLKDINAEQRRTSDRIVGISVVIIIILLIILWR